MPRSSAMVVETQNFASLRWCGLSTAIYPTGNLAHYSFRKSDDKKIVMLGETEEYEPLSRAAYYNAIRTPKEEKE